MKVFDLIVVGGGEHARVVIEAARSRPDIWNVIGFIDPLPCVDTVARMGLPRLGDDDILRDREPREARLVLGVGVVGISLTRDAVVARHPGWDWAAVVHAGAHVSPTANIAPGCVIAAGAVVNSGARIDEHAIINSGAVIEHDVMVGAYCHIGPGAAIGGGTMLGRSCYLGLRASVRDHIRLGDRVLVAMGAAVTASVGDDTCLAGVPARLMTGRSKQEESP